MKKRWLVRLYEERKHKIKKRGLEKLPRIATLTKTEQVVKMTTLGIQDNLSLLVYKK